METEDLRRMELLARGRRWGGGGGGGGGGRRGWGDEGGEVGRGGNQNLPCTLNVQVLYNISFGTTPKIVEARKLQT